MKNLKPNPRDLVGASRPQKPRDFFKIRLHYSLISKNHLSRSQTIPHRFGVTPRSHATQTPPAMAAILLHLIDPAEIDPAWARAQLDPSEVARADRYVFPADALRWSCVRAECRRLLGTHLGIDPAEIRWEFSAHAKPSILGHDLAFNLSHGDTLSALVISPQGPIGVDLELRRRGKDLVNDYAAFCHPEEIATLPADDPSQALIQIWTAKEAFLKALGTGLSLPPEQVCVRENQARGPLPGFKSLHLIRPSHPRLSEHAIAIAAPLDITEIEVHAPRC